MAKLHGRHTRIYLNGIDLSGDINSFEPGYAADTAEVSGFGDSTKKYVVGLADPALRIQGLFNDGTNQIHSIGSSEVGNEVMLNATWGTDQGKFGVGGTVNLDEYSVSSPISGAVTISGALSGSGSNGVFEFLNTILGKQSVPVDPSGWDSGSQSNAGISGHLQFFSGTGTVILQSSTAAAGPTWTDQVNFGLATAPVGIYGTPSSGTVHQYLRAIMNGGTGTAWVGGKRLV